MVILAIIFVCILIAVMGMVIASIRADSAEADRLHSQHVPDHIRSDIERLIKDLEKR